MTKKLDEKALQVCKKMRSQGSTIVEIAATLRGMGYTKLKGGTLCPATVSHFLIDHGMRTNIKRAPYKKTPNQVPLTKQKPPNTDDFMLDIIASDKITREQKIKVLTALL